MRNLLLSSVVLIGLLLTPGSHAQTTVRGQILRNGQFPAGGIQVTLFSPNVGRSSPTRTSADGMYYFYNVPFGGYYLEIWISNPPRAYPVQVAGYPFSDLPRLPVP